MISTFLKSFYELFSEIISFCAHALYIYGEKLLRVFVPRQLKSLDGEIILITGAGNGVGRALALEFAAVACANSKFVCWDVDAVSNQSTVDELLRNGKAAHAYRVDVSNLEEVSRTAEKVRREVGHVTIIVNNAGICPTGPFLLQKPESLEKTFAVNLFAHCWILREFLPQMIRTNHGHIVTIASMSSVAPVNDFAGYSASKHAVHGFVDALKRELRKHPATKLDGINFTTVYPAWVQTKIAEQVNMRPRFPILYPPPLTPEYVAERTVRGVRQNYEYLYLPPVAQILGLVCALLPFDVQHKIGRLFHTEFEHLTLDKNAVREYQDMRNQKQTKTITSTTDKDNSSRRHAGSS